MIDAANITNYALSYEELEARLIFWVLAAGKNGTRAAEITNKMVCAWEVQSPNMTPFEVLRQFKLANIIELCKMYGTGCQSAKGRSLYEIANSGLDLRTCSVYSLEQIYGIGMKTSRCFIMHSRKDARVAGLDTHILKHLASLGYDVPKNTPSSKKLYLTLEQEVVKLADAAGMTPADYDLMIWNKYKIGGNKGNE